MDIAKPTGLTCPQCGGFIPLTTIQLLMGDGIVCPHCGLRLTINHKPSERALEALEKVKRATKKTDA